VISLVGRSPQWQLGSDDRPGADRAPYVQVAAEGFDAVGEASQARTAAEVCAAPSVVLDLH
jgi:hypothetical protein